MTTTTEPYDQRIQALEVANDVRLKRAEMKREITAGVVDIRHVLLNPPYYCERARILDFLTAVPKVGTKRAGRVLAKVQLGPLKTIGSLTERQALALVRELQ